MKKLLTRQLFMLMMLILASCSHNEILNEMEHIKKIGDENPQKALVMLDSLKVEVKESSAYIQSKYELLHIRLNDKAYNMPTSDMMIKKLVDYFEKKGNNQEKQEVYYYAGSVYRDLQDTPRALENFFKSLDIAEGNADCDSVMLSNTYSNLTYLQYRIQNYHNAANFAEKELAICKLLTKDVISPYLHLSEAYLAMNEFQQAKAAMDSTLSYIVNSENPSNHQPELSFLMCHYSDLSINSGINYMSEAKICFSLIKDNPLELFKPFPCLAFAQFYEASGKDDSAAVYSQRVLDDGTSIGNMYDAAKMLYRIYNKKGDEHKAKLYADMYIQLSDSMDYGKRQEQAATVNNQYKYHLDQKKEQKLKEGKEEYKNMMIAGAVVSVLLICVGYILHIKKRNLQLNKITSLSTELQQVIRNEQQLRESVKEKEQKLADKIAQNKTFIKLLHQAELETYAEDVIETIKKAAENKIEMKNAEWKKLYRAVDELYPDFKDKLLEEFNTLSEQQMKVCYLLQIGLPKQQIEDLVKLSHSTVWRIDTRIKGIIHKKE